MRSKSTMTKSTLALLILMAPLAGCGSVRAVSEGPVLGNPPPAIVDALDTAARKDAGAAAWVVGLDRFYQKQDLSKR